MTHNKSFLHAKKVVEVIHESLKCFKWQELPLKLTCCSLEITICHLMFFSFSKCPPTSFYFFFFSELIEKINVYFWKLCCCSLFLTLAKTTQNQTHNMSLCKQRDGGTQASVCALRTSESPWHCLGLNGRGGERNGLAPVSSIVQCHFNCNGDSLLLM